MRKASSLVRATSRERTIGIAVKPGAKEAIPVLRRLSAWLASRGYESLFDKEAGRLLGKRTGLKADALAIESSIMIVIGGDGTFLSIARSAARARTPILGVNLGSLGFLTEVPLQKLFVELDKVLAHRFRLDERMMVEMRILRDGRTVEHGAALNEVVISKQSAVARAVDLNVEVDGCYVTSYKADGLIVSTPTGSTAYSLSAGGPLLDPKLDVLILNPICPHTLTHRPLVLSNRVTVDVTLKVPEDGVYLTLDGQIGYGVRAGDRVRISKAVEKVGIIRTGNRDYFHLLRTKLKWGERLGR